MEDTIKTIDMELLDNQRDSFDFQDSFEYETDNFMNIDNFIDFLKKENCYELMESKLNEYLHFYHKYDLIELNGSYINLREEILNEFTDMIDNSLIYDEESEEE